MVAIISYCKAKRRLWEMTRKFRFANGVFGWAMVLLGMSLGAVVIHAINVHWVSLIGVAALIAASLGVGGVVAVVINVTCRLVFPDGVPVSLTSENISPQAYGKVAKGHFVSFGKAFAIVLAMGIILKGLANAVS